MKQLGTRLLATGVAALVLAAAAAEPERREWTVEGVAREALVYAPPQARTNATPAVFVFHGYGGNMRDIARYFPVHDLWPEALVVYMQGLTITGKVGRVKWDGTGWQNVAGDCGDRDLKFFDAVLDTLRQEYRVDEKRVYAAGHSNGGGFTYLLWATRPYAFDAFAPCAAFSLGLDRLSPKPVLHVAGEKDNRIQIEWQRRMIDALRGINRCTGEGTPWGTNAVVYASRADAPVVALIHPGGHELPPEAARSVVRFFKERAASDAHSRVAP